MSMTPLLFVTMQVTLHIFMVHATIILLTFDRGEGAGKEVFEHVLNNWFPNGNTPRYVPVSICVYEIL